MCHTLRFSAKSSCIISCPPSCCISIFFSSLFPCICIFSIFFVISPMLVNIFELGVYALFYRRGGVRSSTSINIYSPAPNTLHSLRSAHEMFMVYRGCGDQLFQCIQKFFCCRVLILPHPLQPCHIHHPPPPPPTQVSSSKSLSVPS